MLRSLKVLVVAGFAITTLRCTAADESWVHGTRRPDSWTEVPDRLALLVAPAHQQAAQALLARKSAVPISQEDAGRLADGDLVRPTDRTWFLLRGVTANRLAPRFKVEESAGWAAVFFFGTGRGDRRISRIAVVAALRDAPGEVEISCSTAE